MQLSQENYCVESFLWSASSCKPSACMFFKKRLQHKCFPVNSAKLLRIPILRNICKRLLMEVFYKKSRSSSLYPLFFIKFLFFDQMIGLLKLWKMFFISSEKLFSFSRYSNFCNFFPSFPHFPDSKRQMEVEYYDIMIWFA